MLDLETLIRNWSWDEASRRFASEAGAFRAGHQLGVGLMAGAEHQDL